MPVLFFLLWLLLAGEITVRVCLWGAAVTAALTLFCRKVFRWRWERRPVKKLAAGGAYVLRLIKEMLRAGFVVMRLIYTRGRNMEPRMIWFDTTLQSDAARAALADSITLTAGTITVSAENGRFCVHALDGSLAEGIEHCAFQQRLEELER